MTDLAIRIADRRYAADPSDHTTLQRVLANATRTTGVDCTSCRTHMEMRARIAENTGNTTAEAIQVAREVNAAHAEPDSFDARLEAFTAGCAFIHLAHYERLDTDGRVYNHDIRDQGPTLDIPKARNARYARIWANGGSRIFAFVDMKGGTIDKKGSHTRGSVLKPATWKKPAPHERGHIMADDFGLTNIQWTGPAYLA